MPTVETVESILPSNSLSLLNGVDVASESKRNVEDRKNTAVSLDIRKIRGVDLWPLIVRDTDKVSSGSRSALRSSIGILRIPPFLDNVVTPVTDRARKSLFASLPPDPKGYPAYRRGMFSKTDGSNLAFIVFPNDFHLVTV